MRIALSFALVTLFTAPVATAQQRFKLDPSKLSQAQTVTTLEGRAWYPPPRINRVGTTPSFSAITPNIVFLNLDDVGYYDLLDVPTPNIDALAASGVFFTRAYAHSWCAPTRDSVYRSVWDGRFHGDMCGGVVPETLNPTVPSLAKLLDGMGYDTFVLGKWHLGVAPIVGLPWTLSPQEHGFDDWRAGSATSATGGCTNPTYSPSQRVDGGVVTSRNGVHWTHVVGDEVIDSFYEAYNQGRPVFIVANFLDAHDPWQTPPSDLLPPEYTPPIFGTNRTRYEEEIMGLDTKIGEIIAALPSDTWYCLFGDNGTPAEVDEDNLRGSKLSTWEGGVRVPFILSGPGLTGQTINDPVHIVDLVPTLLEGMGTGIPGWVEGASVFSKRGWVVCHGGVQGADVSIESRWKLLRRADGSLELYDLENDPGETTALFADPNDPLVQQLLSHFPVVF